MRTRDFDRRLRALGFKLEGLGGNTLGWTRREDEYGETIVTNGDYGPPGADDPVVVSLVSCEHGEPLWDQHFEGLREALDFLEHPAPLR